MKKVKIVSLILIIAVLILEILPYGAVLNFMGDPEAGITLKYMYSYFDLTPFGYANFGPLLTAILSCIITVLILISNFIKSSLSKIISIFSIASVITSILPLIFGINYYSVIGLFISLLLATITILHLYDMKNK